MSMRHLTEQRKVANGRHEAVTATMVPMASGTVHSVHKAMLLDWLGQQPLTIPRALVDVTGNVVSALWLNHALNHKPVANATSLDWVIEMTEAECTRDTGLTRSQQQTSRRSLADMGILAEAPCGRSKRFHINTARVLELLAIQAQNSSLALD